MNVRPSPIAGLWYPGDSGQLARSIDSFLARARIPALPGQPVGVIAPHAGHRYSGDVAAHAFGCLRGLSADTVAVVGPMHSPHPGVVLTTRHEAYATPLGAVPVDAEAIEQVDDYLSRALGVGLSRVAKDPEHSLEIELPFLQRVLDEFRLIPLMLRAQSARVARAVGEALAAVLSGRPVVLVGSSDLSHYQPQPLAEQLDRAMLARVEAFDPEGVLAAEDEGIGFACGKAAIAATLWAARGLGADRVQVVRYATSAAVTGDEEAVVGYGAAVILR